MKPLYYYSGTIGFYILMVLGSCYIPSVDVIFEFIAAFTINFLGFILPSLFYLKGDSEYRKQR